MLLLKICELFSIVLSIFVSGMFFGPWAGLTISMESFAAESFLAIVHRMSRNMGAVMTVLMPGALLSIVVVMMLAYTARRGVFYLNLGGFGLFVVALVVTMAIEVPIVKQFDGFTVETLPENWQTMRDRWGRFHAVRVGCSVGGLVLLLIAAIFSGNC